MFGMMILMGMMVIFVVWIVEVVVILVSHRSVFMGTGRKRCFIIVRFIHSHVK